MICEALQGSIVRFLSNDSIKNLKRDSITIQFWSIMLGFIPELACTPAQYKK